MNEALLKAWIGAQIRLRNFWEDLKSEENGAVEIIAMILIIVVVIAMVTIFKDRIKTIIENVFGQADDAVTSLGK
ncbi:Flp1 family type IVb pilin [Ruminococcus sp. D55t1_190419_H1]|uniref:Flp1 family type IVb pilin n=1 Tax=Ruminococcus sp. D55t1_190419_H1 TaxID=2787130 RepID=UPI001897E0CC|nr:Flp1 family type IVb pilin [Ruminococcus sp. D55t1_190419_H1]MBS6875569.1 hypothetical protein [Ruminococcus sp.]